MRKTQEFIPWFVRQFNDSSWGTFIFVLLFEHNVTPEVVSSQRSDPHCYKEPELS